MAFGASFVVSGAFAGSAVSGAGCSAAAGDVGGGTASACAVTGIAPDLAPSLTAAFRVPGCASGWGMTGAGVGSTGDTYAPLSILANSDTRCVSGIDARY